MVGTPWVGGRTAAVQNHKWCLSLSDLLLCHTTQTQGGTALGSVYVDMYCLLHSGKAMDVYVSILCTVGVLKTCI